MTTAEERRTAVVDLLVHLKRRLADSHTIEELLMNEFAIEGALLTLNVLLGPDMGDNLMVEARRVYQEEKNNTPTKRRGPVKKH